ncbi:MAG TPA: cytochrome c [Pseudomonadaceae bacterium]|nr:cytochrome c [Pseudomonadaceae bacterium]
MKFPLQLAAIVLCGGALIYVLLDWLGGRAELQDPALLTPVEWGQQLVESRGCTACHSLDGRKGIGPSWYDAWGSERLLQDGRTVVVDAAYLRRAMVDPAGELVAGYDPVMLPSAFTEEEMEAVLALIRGLGTAPGL